MVVGPLVAKFAPGVDTESENALLLISAVVGYLYYVFVRVVETKFPQAGYFLGIAKAPAYSNEPAPSPGPGEEVEAVVVSEDVPEDAFADPVADAPSGSRRQVPIRQVPVRRTRPPS